MPQRNDSLLLDQALFGYADGHRQLASSVRLRSRDMYDLAEVSDLASDVRLGPDDSYITGLLLKDSATYALIKTWPAPEMPRPGSVWSHVLLLDETVLATAIDLFPVIRLFRRPQRASTKPVETEIDCYKARVAFPSASESNDTTASRSVIEHIISRYYRGLPTVLSRNFQAGEIERAIFAVWSQQWPKLRRTFRFRTADFERLPKPVERLFDVQISSFEAPLGEFDANPSNREWIEPAVSDAIVPKMSPLRDFLWRYGADIDQPRKRYQTLVRVFENLKLVGSQPMSLGWAETIFSTFTDDAFRLKSDILGTSTSETKFFEPVSIPDFLALTAASVKASEIIITDEQIRKRLGMMWPSETLSAALTYAELREALAPQSQSIEDVISTKADLPLVLSPAVPSWLVAAVLSRRTDLIEEATLKRLDAESGFSLLQSIDADATVSVLRFWMQQDPKRQGEALLSIYPGEVSLAAAKAYSSRELNSRWRDLIRRHATQLASTASLSLFETAAGLGEFAKLLEFPVDAAAGIFSHWLDAAKRVRKSTKAADISLAAYLVVLNLRLSDESTNAGFQYGLNDLWKAITDNNIGEEVRQFLRRELPDIGYSNWDLCKRLLIALGPRYQRGLVPESLLAKLKLTATQKSWLSGIDDTKNWIFRWW